MQSGLPAGYRIVFRHHGAGTRTTTYEIAVENPHGVSRGIGTAELDGTALDTGITRVPLVDDGEVHRVRIELGSG